MNEQVQIDKSVVKPRRFRVRNLVRFVLMIVVPLGVLFGAAQVYLASGGTIDSENAYVKARLHNVSSEINGRVLSVRVKENERVEKGKVLFELDREPYEIAMRAADL